jgi:cytochrome P450
VSASDSVSADVDFDHHSAAYAADPWTQLAEIRARCPVARTDSYGGFWVVTGYDEIKEVASDDITWSSAQGLTIPDKKNVGQRSIPVEMDPPEFLAFRRILHPMLSPAAVERMLPVIERFVHQAIDDFIEEGSCDLVHDLADPLPAMTTMHKLGLPLERWKEFSVPLHKTVFLRQDNPDRADVVDDLKVIAETISETIAARRESPRDDMISYLSSCDVDGRPVTDREVHEMVTLMIQGGFDTTGSAISNALIQLDKDRGARQRLIDDPALMPSAVEEFLRFEAPQMALCRTATRDVTLGGRSIRKGEQVMLVWAAGNRDPAAFDDPDTVILDRFPNRHMTFGLGAHRCLGSNLARAQIQAALEGVLRRLPDYEIDEESAVRAETVGIAYGMFALPATFTAGERWYPARTA